jgi:hypothetical protein
LPWSLYYYYFGLLNSASNVGTPITKKKKEKAKKGKGSQLSMQDGIFFPCEAV